MQKKIIALAIAAAFSAPAFADTSNVTVYGVADVSYDLTSTGSNTAGTAGFSNNKVSSNTSRLGLKGSEDLGGGLSAIWQIEQLITIDGRNGDGTAAANSFATRNTFAGLSSGSMGTVLLGRHDTPYKIATRGFDVFGDSIADNRAIMGGGSSTVLAPAAGAPAVNLNGAGASFDGRQTDVLAYISPAMSGLTVAAAYVAGAEGQTAATQTKGAAWSLAGLYGNGPLNINGAYEVHDVGSATGTVGAAGVLTILGKTKATEKAWKLGASYAMDAFTVNGVYEKTSDDFGAAGANVLGHKAFYLSGKYSFGSDAVKLAYGNAGDNAAVNTGARQWALGYDHKLSKRTTVYALYTQLRNDSAASYALGSNGIGNGSVYMNGAGSKPSAVSLGMKHTF